VPGLRRLGRSIPGLFPWARPEIAQTCRRTKAATADVLNWIANPRNEKKLSQDRSKIERILRRNAAEARRLENTLEQPTCIGVFGTHAEICHFSLGYHGVPGRELRWEW
jgi:hypothetical protein